MDAQDPELRPYGRRAFLGVVGVGLSSLVWGAPAWRWLEGRLHGVADALPAGVRELAPNGAWRIYSVGDSLPVFDPRTWRLRIGGLVERPLALSYDELRALPRAHQVSDFHCVTGWTVKDVRWTGVRFADLLARARVKQNARALRFQSLESPYTESLTLEQALLPDAMVAYEMDGKPLSRGHGAPARVVIPDMYGYKNTKWLARIDLVAAPVDGYWEGYGWKRDAWIHGGEHVPGNGIGRGGA